MKAEIKQYQGGLFLDIDGDDKVSFAITEEELLPIRDAIDEYLIKMSQLKSEDSTH